MKTNNLGSKLVTFGFLAILTLSVGLFQPSIMPVRAANTGVTIKAAPNPQLDLPPMYPHNLDTLEGWFRSGGRPWHKQEIALSRRKILCIDLEPYSGQPGHHVFLYQLVGDRPALLFAAMVWNPPNQEVGLSFVYKGKEDSLDVVAKDISCFSVKLSSLWCDSLTHQY